VKQVYLRQHSIALSLTAAIVCCKCAEQDWAAQRTEITAQSFQLENIFKDFKLFTEMSGLSYFAIQIQS